MGARPPLNNGTDNNQQEGIIEKMRRLSKEEMLEMASSERRIVFVNSDIFREEVAYNENCPIDILIKLSDDGDENAKHDVREIKNMLEVKKTIEKETIEKPLNKSQG